MKKIVFILAFFFIVPSVFAAQSVKGHMKDTDGDGIKDTYVGSYQRSSPNKTKLDNYSTPGNYNPYKGEITPGNPDRESSQDYYKSKKKSSW